MLLRTALHASTTQAFMSALPDIKSSNPQIRASLLQAGPARGIGHIGSCLGCKMTGGVPHESFFSFFSRKSALLWHHALLYPYIKQIDYWQLTILVLIELIKIMLE